MIPEIAQYPKVYLMTYVLSFGVPLPESESEFPSYPHYPQGFRGVKEEEVQEEIQP